MKLYKVSRKSTIQFRLSSNSFRVCTFKELNILKSNEMKKFVFVIPRTQQCHPFELNQSLFLLNYGPKLCEVCLLLLLLIIIIRRFVFRSLWCKQRRATNASDR